MSVERRLRMRFQKISSPKYSSPVIDIHFYFSPPTALFTHKHTPTSEANNTALALLTTNPLKRIFSFLSTQPLHST